MIDLRIGDGTYAALMSQFAVLLHINLGIPHTWSALASKFPYHGGKRSAGWSGVRVEFDNRQLILTSGLTVKGSRLNCLKGRVSRQPFGTQGLRLSRGPAVFLHKGAEPFFYLFAPGRRDNESDEQCCSQSNSHIGNLSEYLAILNAKAPLLRITHRNSQSWRPA